MILGALLAGGRSTRFGSDKALARIGGVTLLDRNARALAGQVDRVVVCGREWPGHDWLTDRPEPGLGPLGGLAAALHRGNAEHYWAVLSLPVDALNVPLDLLSHLGPNGPRYFRDQHLIGLWPTSLSATLDAHLASGQRSVRSWISVCGASSVAEPHAIGNANCLSDLMGYAPVMH